MHVRVFNACMLAGWLLVTAGGVWLNPGAGLVASGLLLIALALLSTRLAGVYVPKDEA